LKVKCIIFDFDRTLVNLRDSTDWDKARELVAETYIKNRVPKSIVSKYDRGPFILFYGVYREISSKFSKSVLRRIQGEVSRAIERYEVEGALRAELMPACKRVLEWVSRRGIKIAIVSTNSERAIEIALSRLDIARFIQLIIGRDPIPERVKPYSYQIRYALEKLGYEKSEAIVVGDGVDDMLPAKELGIFAIGVLTGQTAKDELMKAGANRVIDDLTELPQIIEKFVKES
jgi:HAD superfamily hydrolase (TIGR01549 family)